MDSNPQDIALIDQYFAGLLNESEQASFSARRASDPEFAVLVRDMELIREMAIDSGKERLAEDIRAARTRFQEDEHPGSNRRIIWGIAASIVLLAVMGWIYISSNNSVDGKEVFKREFFAMEELESSLGSVQDSGFAAYRDEKYAKALEYFDRILPSDENYCEIQVYRGVCHLALTEPDSAISVLETYLNDAQRPCAEIVLYHTTRWYLALAYVWKNDFENAKTSLREILDEPGHNLYPAAVRVMGEID
ncbi:MAG: tetratricopeptide repeat protein [Bacteroidota bacterium]